MCSSFRTEKSGQLFIDRNYTWHPFVSAHVRALRGDTVEWRAGSANRIQARVTPIRDASGAVIGVTGIAVDHHGEGGERMRRTGAEIILSKILKEIDQPVSLVDEDMRILMVSSSFCDAATIDANDAILRGLDEVVVMRRSDGSSGGLTDGEEYTWEGAGSRQFKSRHFTCSSGDLRFGIEISEDISREENLHSEVFVANHARSVILEEFTQPVALLKSSAGIDQVNEALASMLGVLKGAMVGSNLNEWVNPGFRDRLTHACSEVSAHGETREEEVIFQNAAGGVILAKFDLKKLSGSEGNPSLLLLKFTDWGDPAEKVHSSRAQNISDMDGVILEMLAAGEGNARIAQLLCLSRQGLDYRLKTLRKQIDAASRGALVGRAYALGLLDPLAWPPRLRRQSQ